METQSRDGRGSRPATGQGGPNVGTPTQGGETAQAGGSGAPAEQRSEQGTQSRASSGRSLSSRRSAGDLTRGAGMQQHPFSTMLQLSREMDRLMDSFFGRQWGAPTQRFGSWPFEGNTGAAAEGGMPELWSPRIDVRERGDSIVVSADLPGVRKEDIRIEATQEGLAISGDRREERQEGEGREGYRMIERSYGSFYREIPLPEGAKVEESKANMREGVLEITIPVQQSQGRRQIRIE